MFVLNSRSEIQSGFLKTSGSKKIPLVSSGLSWRVENGFLETTTVWYTKFNRVVCRFVPGTRKNLDLAHQKTFFRLLGRTERGISFVPAISFKGDSCNRFP